METNKVEVKQTEVFRNFVKVKQFDVSDALGLLDRCADRLALLENYFAGRKCDDNDFTEQMSLGVAGILEDIGNDIRLISADMAAEVDRDMVQWKKKRAEEKKNETKGGSHGKTGAGNN